MRQIQGKPRQREASDRQREQEQVRRVAAWNGLEQLCRRLAAPVHLVPADGAPKTVNQSGRHLGITLHSITEDRAEIGRISRTLGEWAPLWHAPRKSGCSQLRGRLGSRLNIQ